MRYILVLFWSFILGQVVSYIGGALTDGTYNFQTTTIASLIVGFIILLIGKFSLPTSEKKKHI